MQDWLFKNNLVIKGLRLKKFKFKFNYQHSQMMYNYMISVLRLNLFQLQKIVRYLGCHIELMCEKRFAYHSSWLEMMLCEFVYTCIDL